MGQCAAFRIRHDGKAPIVPKCSEGCVGACSHVAPLLFHTSSIMDDYDIMHEVLGRGISGTVRVIKRRTTGEKFALKILLDVPIARREIELQHMCLHPHVVRILEVYENVFRETKLLLVVMEYMGGGALFERIKKGRLTEREAARIVHDVGSAVAYIHSLNVAHRDIKPENILYTKKGVLKLADFGFAKQNHEGADHPLRTACYTNYYAPPEILQRVRYDKSCDMWSLGVVMYILLCSYPPFYSEHSKDFSAGMQLRIKTGDYGFPSPEWDVVSDDAKSLVCRLLVTDPSRRLTIEEMMADPWIVTYLHAPKTPLLSPYRLDTERLLDIQEVMGKELTGMRMANDELQIKPLAEANNKILMRRKQMKEAALAALTATEPRS